LTCTGNIIIEDGASSLASIVDKIKIDRADIARSTVCDRIIAC
jgi:hypothetical protein